ncbi:response regulator [Jannaschia formosa]|uniref:response regulator n=1 Tax=Jannaschia formosa TaxID=2259592 RepID=UPI000E1BF8A7|nr:response regulator [Jannaschia formosa]TFL16575.1 response regulator [Jannaschia formosa]
MQVEAAGHQVVSTARTAAEAVVEARRIRPALVLMDIRLADGSSGTDAAADLYRDLGIRCAFLSGSLDRMMREQLAALEPLGLLSKPVTPTLLRATLDATSSMLDATP